MDLLINLNSPVVNKKKQNTNYNTRSPLVPSNSIPSNNEFQNNNPFDDVVDAIQCSLQPKDPFDMVLQKSIYHDKQLLTKQCLQTSPDTSNKNTIIIKNNLEKERSLHSSLSQVDLTKTENQQQTSFRRSFSAGIIRRNSICIINENSVKNVCTKLNTSLPSEAENKQKHCVIVREHVTGGFVVQRKEIQAEPGASNKEFESTKKELREAANYLQKLIKYEPSNDSKGDILDVRSMSSEDLIDIRAPWECLNIYSDDEDSIGLPRLQFQRHSFSGLSNSIIDKPPIDKNIIHKYLKKRCSVDYGLLDEKDKDIDTSQDISFSPSQVAGSSSFIEDLDNEPPTESKPCDKFEDKKIDDVNVQNLRVKKTINTDVVKKGPMKAVVSLEKMTKNFTSKISSPIKKTVQRNSKVLKEEENPTETGIKPILTSTPKAMNSRMRGRENNMSPINRTYNKRSSSVGSLENSKEVSQQNKISNSPVRTDSKEKTSKISVTNKERPQTAPTTSINKKSICTTVKRSVLKTLSPKTRNKLGSSNAPKNVSKIKSVSTVPTHDKENQVTKK